MKEHEVHLFENGTASIRSTAAGQTMHSSIGPDAEARTVYLEQSDLRARLEHMTSAPLVLLDIGMGIAANALAALEVALGSPRPLHLISFEKDLEGLEIALENPQAFPSQNRHAEKLRALLREHRWTDGKISWELRQRDFLQIIGSPLNVSAEVVFYDFYSPQSCPELWGSLCFDWIAKNSRNDVLLTTYSAATAVRSALLLAGFFVGRGSSTDRKSETTVASLEISKLRNPLGPAWLEKLGRSSRPFSADLDPIQALAKLRDHPQFRDRTPLRS